MTITAHSNVALLHNFLYKLRTYPSLYSDVIMGTMASQITSLTIVYSTVLSGAENIKAPRHWPLCGEWWPVNFPHKWLVTLGANARGCRPTPSSRWRRTLPSLRLITGKFTDTAHLLKTHTSWGYCRWYEEHWGGVSSRDRQSFSRNSNLKSCVMTRVVRISVYSLLRRSTTDIGISDCR